MIGTTVHSGVLVSRRGGGTTGMPVGAETVGMTTIVSGCGVAPGLAEGEEGAGPHAVILAMINPPTESRIHMCFLTILRSPGHTSTRNCLTIYAV